MNVPTTTDDSAAKRRRRSSRAGLALVALAALAVLTGCSVTGSAAPDVTPSAAASASAQSVCDTAGDLTRAGEPARALEIIEQFRDGRPVTPTPSPTPTRRGSTPTPAPSMTPPVECEPQRLAAIDALGGGYLTEEVPSPAESFAKDWNRVAAALLVPLGGVLAATAGVLLVLLVLARLGALLPRMPWFSTRTAAARGVLGLGGAALMLASAALLAATFALGQLGIMIAFIVTGLIGSALAACWLAGRLAVSIEVRRDDKSVREASAEVIALLQEIGAAPPRGIEVPISTDVTALKDALVSAPVANPVIQLARALLATVLGSTPWRVLVSIGDDDASVIITRNRRAVAAHRIGPTTLVPADLAGSAAAVRRPAAAAGDSAADVATAPGVPFVAEGAAAAILVALAAEYDGFEGLAGATQWKSVARHFIATTEFRHDEQAGRRLLALALEDDPANLLAEISLQYLLKRRAKEPAELAEYMTWLDLRIERLVRVRDERRPGEDEPESVIGGAGTDIPREEALTGYLDVVRRLLLSYAAAGMNLRAMGPDRTSKASDPRPEVLLRNLERLVHFLADDQPSSGGLRDRMRPIAALMYVQLVTGERGSKSVVDGWADLALESASPSVAFNAACYYSESWSDHLSSTDKQRIEAQIADRLQYALPIPYLWKAAGTDPVLARHRTHQWYIDLLARYAPAQD